MDQLLYIQASPRDRSKSTLVARAFLESYQQTHPDDAVKTINIFEKDLPAFDTEAVQAKYDIMHNRDHTPEQARAWASVEAVIAEFKEADKYLISVPMWNFGIPYRLKHYLDILIQPGYTFTVNESGYQGLIKDKPVMVLYARGGGYSEGSGAEAYDMQKPYLELALGFIGFTDIRSVIVEPTMHGEPEAIEKMIQASAMKAAEIAKDF